MKKFYIILIAFILYCVASREMLFAIDKAKEELELELEVTTKTIQVPDREIEAIIREHQYMNSLSVNKNGFVIIKENSKEYQEHNERERKKANQGK